MDCSPIWEAPDPLLALRQERENPTRVFLLNSKLAATSGQGPFD